MKLHNTLTRKMEEFQPLEDKKVKLYSCGLTVYSQPHIGNWVPYIYWDVLARTLRASGYDVDRVQNITDVGHLTSDEDAGEDKMLKSALKEGSTAWEVADKYIKVAEHEAFELLGLEKPEHMPRATDYIPQQIALVQQLEKRGLTYVIDDGVYFDTSKIDDYGELARLDIKGLRFGARVENTGKKTPTDFAVWKFSNPAEKRDMEWASPWGKGFPGWHLECSAMIREILGDQIDIHTGGIDHIPVHHTNEIAQSESVTGKRLARYWLHNNHLKVNGTKIAKSLGNGYTLKDILEKGFDVQAFKLMVLSKHYRTEGNFTWEILEASQNRLNHWKAVADLYWQRPHSEVSTGMLSALQADLNTPAAVAMVDRAFEKIELADMSPSKDLLTEITDLLGISIVGQDISDGQKELLTKRQVARDNKDFGLSDRIREELEDKKTVVRDTSSGQIWSRL